MTEKKKRWAFISVQDTTGIVDFTRGLIDNGFNIIATADVAGILKSGKIKVTSVEEITQFPTILGGIVKSIHPRILAGIMADRNDPRALAECEENNVPLFDMIVVNHSGTEHFGADSSPYNKNLGISPSLLMRTAAINYKHVLVVTKPHQYPGILVAVTGEHETSQALNLDLAREAWSLSVHHDIAVARELDNMQGDPLPPVLRGEYHKVLNLRYGENPHQKASLYSSPYTDGPSVANARLVAGTPLSYNNIVDADVGLNLVLEFAAPGAVIIKHAMPVSAAFDPNVATCLEKAFSAEWATRIGAAIACNNIIDEDAAQAIIQPGRSIDLIIAADFTLEAAKMLRHSDTLKGEVRLLKAGSMRGPAGTGKRQRVAIHHVSGGVLAQTVDNGVYGSGGFHVVTEREPTDAEMVDLEFACLVAKHTRSHAAVLAKDGATISVATVQTSLAEAAHIALERAGNRAVGTVMASDGTVNLAQVAMLAEAGVKAIIHTGSKVKDETPIIQACNQYGIAMIVTRMRHYSHV